MFVASLRDVWEFKFASEFNVVVLGRIYPVRVVEKQDWHGYMYISPERDCLLCFDHVENLLRTLEIIEKGKKDGK